MITDDEIKALIKEYSLSNEDLNRHSPGLVLVSRRGILKIINAAQLNVRKQVKEICGSIVVVTRVSGRMGVHAYTEATGEASKENCSFKFPVAVAEKRSESRAVLTHIGVYHKGVIGEVELDEETDITKILSERTSAVNKITQQVRAVVVDGEAPNLKKKKNA